MRGLTGCLSLHKGSFQGLNSRIGKDSKVRAFRVSGKRGNLCTSAASYNRN